MHHLAVFSMFDQRTDQTGFFNMELGFNKGIGIGYQFVTRLQTRQVYPMSFR